MVGDKNRSIRFKPRSTHAITPPAVMMSPSSMISIPVSTSPESLVHLQRFRTTINKGEIVFLSSAPPCPTGPHQSRSGPHEHFHADFLGVRDSLCDCFDFTKAAEDAPSRDSP
jgi:hypothetical protein